MGKEQWKLQENFVIKICRVQFILSADKKPWSIDPTPLKILQQKTWDWDLGSADSAVNLKIEHVHFRAFEDFKPFLDQKGQKLPFETKYQLK